MTKGNQYNAPNGEGKGDGGRERETDETDETERQREGKDLVYKHTKPILA